MNPNNPPESRSSRRGGCISLILLLLALWWLVSITAARLSAQITASAALTQIPNAWWALFPLVQGILLIPILALLVWLAKNQPAHGILAAWLWSSFYVLLLAPLSLLPLTAAQLQALLTAGLSLLFASLVGRFTRPAQLQPQPSAPNAEPPPVVPLSEAASTPHLPRPFTWRLTAIILLAFAIPWLAWGALGSILDTLLMLLAGLCFGWAAYRILDRVLLPALASSGFSPQAAFLTGGFAAAILLALLSTGLGFAFGAIQLILAIALLPMGWIAVYFLLTQGPAAPSPGWRRIFSTPIPWLLGIAAAIPLAFIDPDELALVISASPGEILQVGLRAAGASALIGFVFAFIFLLALFTNPTKSLPERPAGKLGLPLGIALLGILAAGVYLFIGQPGFFGEGLFVELDSQADLSAAKTTADPAQRRQLVYQTLVENADTTQESLRQQLDRLGVDYTPYYLVNALQLQSNILIRAWLLTRPDVAQVYSVPNLRPLPAPAPPARGSLARPSEPMWNLTKIGADRVWRDFGVTGSGVVIGQSDSGAQWDHPDLADSYRGQNGDHDYNWFDPWYTSDQPQDIKGHGTHTLGSAVGNSTGVAPDAEWIACTNMWRNLGNPAHYLDCMQFHLAPFPIGGDPLTDGDPKRGANILNNSWGCPEFEGCRKDSLQPAVHALTQAGVFVVSSAGNDGPFCASLDEPLAIYPDVLTVGAVDENGILAFFSSIGPVDEYGGAWVKPDITAPGEFILSTLPGGTYGEQSGTSMASPHVVGVVALMWSANPRLIGDIEATRQILIDTSQEVSSESLPGCPGVASVPSNAVGYGLVDAYRAVQAALERK
jgi:subtilisin family serine protease